MKVYRCLCEKDEIELFKNKIISLNANYNDYSDITLNTHDYGMNDVGFDKKIKRDRIHFFLFKEDAVEYMNNYIGHDCFIAEYEIPDYLVLPNIGIGIYTNNENKVVLETAIPFGHILKDVNYEQYLIYYDLYKYNKLNIKYLNWKIELQKKYKIDRIPSKVVKCEYPIRLLSKEDINFSINYDIFNLLKGYKKVLNILGLKVKMNDNKIIFEQIKKADLKELRELLVDHNLIEEKKFQKTK